MGIWKSTKEYFKKQREIYRSVSEQEVIIMAFRPSASPTARAVGGLAIGFWFGWLLRLTTMAHPAVIVAQLRMQQMAMMQTFVAATATGMTTSKTGRR